MSLTQNRFQIVTKTPAAYQASQSLFGGIMPAKPPAFQTPFVGGLTQTQTFLGAGPKIAAKKQNARAATIKMGGAAELAEFRGKVN